MLLVLSRCFSNVAFALSISDFAAPFFNFFCCISSISFKPQSHNCISSSFYLFLLFHAFFLLVFILLNVFSWILIGSMTLISITFGYTSFSSRTFIRFNNDLSLQNVAGLSLNIWVFIVEFSYISIHASFILFINAPRFSIFSKLTFI